MSQYAKKLLRAGHVNQAIRIIADHGRRFFYSYSHPSSPQGTHTEGGVG